MHRSGSGSPMRLASAFRSARDTGRHVTCTVVSVMPYMLTSCGRWSPYRPNHPASWLKTRASPPKTTRRSDGSGAACAASADARWPKALGVWFSTVTPSCRSSVWKSAGEREVSYGTTTRRPPYSSAPHISHTEKSNANEWNSVQTSWSENAKRDSLVLNSRSTLPCVTWTPLGRPVEPEVKIT